MADLPKEYQKEPEKEKSNEDIGRAINPNFTGSETSPKSESRDDILSQLDPFEKSKEAPKAYGQPPNEPEDDLLEEAPSPTSSQQEYYSQPVGSQVGSADVSRDQISEVAESIVDEKWSEFISKVGDIVLWKETVNNELIAIKQEIIRTQDRFNSLQSAILGKVNEYGKDISSIGTEMKALEQVFQKILQPLTTNVKELSKLTNKLKKK